mmetsp:Transcript_23737/g.52083  ORF Transcript_23737/g.52083 Transcript_23737/m.52083 type:complete len:309 (-) Transcript_23737:236-1162(-)
MQQNLEIHVSYRIRFPTIKRPGCGGWGPSMPRLNPSIPRPPLPRNPMPGGGPSPRLMKSGGMPGCPPMGSPFSSSSSRRNENTSRCSSSASSSSMALWSSSSRQLATISAAESLAMASWLSSSCILPSASSRAISSFSSARALHLAMSCRPTLDSCVKLVAASSSCTCFSSFWVDSSSDRKRVNSRLSAGSSRSCLSWITLGSAAAHADCRPRRSSTASRLRSASCICKPASRLRSNLTSSCKLCSAVLMRWTASTTDGISGSRPGPAGNPHSAAISLNAVLQRSAATRDSMSFFCNSFTLDSESFAA